jgi:hypothetical protein
MWGSANLSLRLISTSHGKEQTPKPESHHVSNIVLVHPNNGCILYFPAGIYVITGLTLRSYMNLKGDGWGTSVIRLKAPTASDVLTVPIDAFNFSIKDLTLDGNSTRGGSGNCLSVAPTEMGPAEWNPANKRTALVNAQKWGYIDEVMFTHCSADGSRPPSQLVE